MDYAELKRKFEYTDQSIDVREYDGFKSSWDPIADEEDLNKFYRSVVTDFRPDPRTMEEDQKQTQTDSVGTLRLHYHGIRYGDDPDYHKELFLEQTEKEPRRTFTDPDFRESVKQSWGRQVFLERNLYPEDPSTGSITQGTKSQFGIQIQKLEGRALTEPRMKGVLEDTLDGTEPRRIFRYDNYSFVDKALANQGDLPYVLGAAQLTRDTMKATPLADGSGIVWTDGDITLAVAKLGRGGPHRSGEIINKIGRNQLHKPDASGAEVSRGGLASDGVLLAKAAVSQTLLDTIKKVIDDVKRPESQNSKNRSKLEWGSLGENIRAAIDAQQSQSAMNEIKENDGRSVATGRLDIVNIGQWNGQIEMKNLLEKHKEAINKYKIPMSALGTNTEISQKIQRELEILNKNWRMETINNNSRSRANGADDIQRSIMSAETTKPWNETTGRVLEVATFRRQTSMDPFINGTAAETQAAKINSTIDKTSISNVGKFNGIPGSIIYNSNQGTRFGLDLAAAAGSMGGVAAPLTTKQHVRFDVEEKNNWVEDRNQMSG